MSFLNNRTWTRVLKTVAILACIAAAIFSGGSSCSKKSTSVDDDTLKQPPWNQMEIDLMAAWSPDGSKIIYTRDQAIGRDTSWAWGVYLYDVSSARDTCIFPETDFLGISWSPDGERIAVTAVDAQIYVYSFVDSSTRQITHQNRNFSVCWSPCGDKLSFCVRTNLGGLFIYDFATDSITHVVSRVQADAGDWMADCSTLVMHDSAFYDPSVIVKYNIYTDSVKVIAKLPGYKREIALSPDQKTIVFGVENDLWSIDISGNDLTRLTTEGGGYPDWSPDGQWIVYTKIDRRNGYLWLMRPDGSEKHQITF